MTLNTAHVCKQPKHKLGRLSYGRAMVVSVGTGPQTSDWKPPTSSGHETPVAQKPFHTTFPHQELCRGGTRERNTGSVSTGGTEAVPVPGPQHAPSAGVTRRGCGISITGDAQILRYIVWSKPWAAWSGQTCFKEGASPKTSRGLFQPKLFCASSHALTAWWDETWVWIIAHSYGNEGWLQAEGGKAWFSPPRSGRCWEQDWEQRRSAEHPQIRNSRSEQNVVGH